MKTTIFTLCTVFVFVCTMDAKRIEVPNQHSTIQSGINVATHGDTVLVAEGTYYENINFKGKAITVASQFIMDGDTSHISTTIIDGSKPSHPDTASVVMLDSGEDSTSVLNGFTITGGAGTKLFVSPLNRFVRYGGGILAKHMCGGKFINNIITKNTVISSYYDASGGGISCINYNDSLNIVIRNNKIYANQIQSPSYAQGGGISIVGTGGYRIIEYNSINNNSATCTGIWKANGGGVVIGNETPWKAHIIIRNNKIYENKIHCVAAQGGGIFLTYPKYIGIFFAKKPTVEIYNNIIANNSSTDYAGGVAFWDQNSRGDYWMHPSLTFYNNTIINNHAKKGVGLFNYRMKLLVYNNIFNNDLNETGSTEVFTDDKPYSDSPTNNGVILAYNNSFSDDSKGTDNVQGYPAVDPETFHLSKGSPCIDTGTAAIEVEGNVYSAPLKDIWGNIRPHTYSNLVDLGAIESPYATSDRATLIHIPREFPSIQEGINAATDGDTVLVSEGLYYENINYNGKAITVASHFLMDGDTSHISKTIIDGSKSSKANEASTVTIRNAVDTLTILNGLTIRGGKGSYFSTLGFYVGGGIFIEGNATILNNHIKNNSIQAVENLFGGGIYGISQIKNSALTCKILIQNNQITSNNLNGSQNVKGAGVAISGSGTCDFKNNTVEHNVNTGTVIVNGGGIFIDNLGITRISGNTFALNLVNATYPIDFLSGGGGIFISNGPVGNTLIVNNVVVNNQSPHGAGIQALGISSGFSFNLVNNTIVHNNATVKGGGLHLFNGHCNAINNIIWENEAPTEPDVYYRGTLEMEYCITQTKITGIGNQQVDPKMEKDTYRLEDKSPAIDAGNPDEKYNDLSNIENTGKPKFPSKGGLRSDIGAFGGNDYLNIESSEYAIQKRFLYGEFKGINYRLAQPTNYNPDKNYPLTVVFHGALNYGNDNEKQLMEGLAWRVNAEYFGYNEFTLVPQAPTSSLFKSLSSLYEIIESIIAQNSIDTSRIAITGWSYGGRITIDMTNKYPDFFLAGIPVSARYVSYGNINKENPIWAFHGENDNIEDPSGAQNFISYMEKKGITAILTEENSPGSIDNAIKNNASLFYSEINNATHFIVEYAYDNPYLFKWLNKQAGISTHAKDLTDNTLFSVYPNPTCGNVSVHFNVDKKQAVKLGIYNVLGQQEVSLLNEVRVPGAYEVEVDISALHSGVYFIVLESDTKIATRLIKQ